MKLINDRYKTAYLVGLILLALVFWNTLLIYPIKLFVVMLHEMSHGLMAVLFGGEIIEIQIDKRIGGYCKYLISPSFWSTFMTSSAGYLGSLLWGSLILILAVRLKKDKYITLTIGVLLLILSFFVIKSGELFGIAMTLGLGLFMLIAFRFFGALFHDLWLKFIGFICCTYVIIDIKRDLIDNHNIDSDADKIAEITGFSSVFVGVTWMIIAIVTVFFVLRYIYKYTKSKLAPS